MKVIVTGNKILIEADLDPNPPPSQSGATKKLLDTNWVDIDPTDAHPFGLALHLYVGARTKARKRAAA